MSDLVVYFDYRSPFAFMLSEVLPARLAPHGARADWRPIDLLALSSFANGLPYSEKKRAYVFVDAARQAAFHDVSIRPPRPFPVEPELALRLAIVARRAGGFEALHPLLFRAAWQDESDLAAEEVLARCIEASGGDAAWLAAAREPDVGEALASLNAEAEEAGVFGVPTIVRDGELFWGLDCLPALEWRLAGGQ